MAVAARALLVALSCKLCLAWPGQRPWNGSGFARKEGVDTSGDGSSLGGRVFDMEGAGLVVRAKDLCIKKDLRTVHAAEFIFRSVVPDAMSGLIILMLRPLGPDRRTWSIVRASDLKVVEHSSVVRVSRIADGSLSINDMCASTHTTLDEFSKTLQVPADTRVNFYFQPRHEGLEGDCLAWYVPAGGAGGILASSQRVETSQNFEVLAWPDGKATPQEGAQLVFGSASSLPYLVSWRVTVSYWDLQQWPRQHRMWALSRKVMPSVCMPGLTTEAFKRGILTFFRAPEWADSAAIEIGALRGSTTVFLSMVFSLVFAVEIYCGAFAGFPNVRNVVKLCLDSSKDYAFSMLAENSNIQAAVIDGDHRYMRVIGDIFRVLHDIPCCVSVIAFHDYCDDEVSQAINVFVEGGVLRYREPLGENPGSFFWCKEGRPEGAIFTVLRPPSMLAFQQRLESVHQRVMGWSRLADLEADLEGSEWVLTSDRGEMGHIVLRVQPRPCELFWLPPHGQTVPEELKVLRLIGWSQQDEYNTRWSAQVLAGELFDGESGQPLASISFDFALTGFTLVMSPLGIERYGRSRGQGFIGIRRSHIADLSTTVDWRNR